MALNALNRHLVLVGFMGSGKTTLGREAAARLGRAFLDLDEAIAERAGKSIAALFEERGEQEFRRIEEHATEIALRAPEPGLRLTRPAFATHCPPLFHQLTELVHE